MSPIHRNNSRKTCLIEFTAPLNLNDPVLCMFSAYFERESQPRDWMLKRMRERKRLRRPFKKRGEKDFFDEKRERVKRGGILRERQILEERKEKEIGRRKKKKRKRKRKRKGKKKKEKEKTTGKRERINVPDF